MVTRLIAKLHITKLQIKIQMGTFFREHQMSALKWGIYILICSICTWSQTEPSEPAVKQFLSFVQSLGLIAVILVPAARGSWDLLDLISRFLCGLAVYLTALWLIGHGGDTLYGLVLKTPNGVAVGIAALITLTLFIIF